MAWHAASWLSAANSASTKPGVPMASTTRAICAYQSGEFSWALLIIVFPARVSAGRDCFMGGTGRLSPFGVSQCNVDRAEVGVGAKLFHR